MNVKIQLASSSDYILFIFIMINKQKEINQTLNNIQVIDPRNISQKNKNTLIPLLYNNPQISDSYYCAKAIPLKEYSNKFLRQSKPNKTSANSFFRTKNSCLFVRLSSKRKINKENIKQKCKTTSSELQRISSDTLRTSSFNVKNNVIKISTSRALEYFSKIYKKTETTKLKFKKNVEANGDIETKQLQLMKKFQEKQKKASYVCHQTSRDRKIKKFPKTVKTQKTQSSVCDDNLPIDGWQTQY